VTRSQPDLDAAAQPPHIPPNSGDAAASERGLDRALRLVRFLRANCEWDAAQTPRSLLPYLLEEAHETAEAVAAGDDAELERELGDLLLNVAFQIVLAEERGAFTADHVVTTLEAKMRRRHPHLYGDGPREDWETLKRREAEAEAEAEAGGNAEAGGEAGGEAEAGGVPTGAAGAEGMARAGQTVSGEGRAAGLPSADARGRERRSLLDGLAGGLEPLSKAQRLQERVATVGFDWPSAQGAFDKVVEEIDEVREHLQAGEPDALEDELGDLLFAVVNLTRLSGAHAMLALMRANDKFTGRFRALERLAAVRGVILGEATLADLDTLWDEVKRT
jgi:nucleoside triphosphate diphosphatase